MNELEIREVEVESIPVKEYGDGFFFSDAKLDSPNLEKDTKAFMERILEIEKDCKERVSPSVKVRLVWDWNISRNKWYPQVVINWDGSEFNAIRFDLDYSYRILYAEGQQIELTKSTLAAAVKLFIMLKN